MSYIALALLLGLAALIPGTALAGDRHEAEREAQEPFGWFLYMPTMGNWGVSAVLPAGDLGFRYKFDHAWVQDWFNPDGDKAPLLPPVDVMGGSLDFNGKFDLQSHYFYWQVGVGKGIAVQAEMNFMRWRPSFDTVYVPPDSLTAKAAAAFLHLVYGIDKFTAPGPEGIQGLWQTVELMGRPAPDFTEEGSGLQPGDFKLSAGWNYLRTRHVSLLGFVQAIFPTGHMADPDKNLYFGLGTDLDVGYHCWGGGVGQVVDVLLPQPLDFVVLSAEVDFAAYAKTQRPSPTVFGPPAPLVEKMLEISGTDVGPLFADLSGLAPTYGYRPGNQVTGTFQVRPTLLGSVPLSFGCRAYHSHAAEIDTNLKAFSDYLNYYGFFDEAYGVSLFARAGVNIYKFSKYLPVKCTVGYARVIWGKTTPIMDWHTELSIDILLPTSLL